MIGPVPTQVISNSFRKIPILFSEDERIEFYVCLCVFVCAYIPVRASVGVSIAAIWFHIWLHLGVGARTVSMMDASRTKMVGRP